jgi:DNA-binding CsgD family transcriptional regulator
MPYPAAFLIRCLVERNQLDEAEAVLDAVPRYEGSADLWQTMLLDQARGFIQLARRDFDQAARTFMDLGKRSDEWGTANPAVICWRSPAAEALAGLGDRDAAIRLADAEIELARGMRSRRALGVALIAGAKVRGGAEGLELAREAVAVLERSPAALERARARLTLGTLLRAAGRRSDARPALRGALDLAAKLRADAIAQTALEELVICGARPRREHSSGVEALTASELRVARMAAGGMANRQIAQALFVTEKTVELHLTHVYSKLGVGSRRELPPALDDAAA